METEIQTLKKALVLKLLKLGFNAAICQRCGKIFEKTEETETLCQDCKRQAKIKIYESNAT